MLPVEVLQEGFWCPIPNHQMRKLAMEAPECLYLYQWFYDAVTPPNAQTRVDIETPMYWHMCQEDGCGREWEGNSNESFCPDCMTYSESNVITRVRAKVLWGKPLSMTDILNSLGTLEWSALQVQLAKLDGLGYIERDRVNTWESYSYYVSDCYKFDEKDARLSKLRKNQKEREPVGDTTKAPKKGTKKVKDTSTNTELDSTKTEPTKDYSMLDTMRDFANLLSHFAFNGDMDYMIEAWAQDFLTFSEGSNEHLLGSAPLTDVEIYRAVTKLEHNKEWRDRIASHGEEAALALGRDARDIAAMPDDPISEPKKSKNAAKEDELPSRPFTELQEDNDDPFDNFDLTECEDPARARQIVDKFYKQLGTKQDEDRIRADATLIELQARSYGYDKLDTILLWNMDNGYWAGKVQNISFAVDKFDKLASTYEADKKEKKAAIAKRDAGLPEYKKSKYSIVAKLKKNRKLPTPPAAVVSAPEPEGFDCFEDEPD